MAMATDTDRIRTDMSSDSPRKPGGEDPGQSQGGILTGLRAVVGAVDDLMSCEDMDTLYRRAVEFCRHELGLERCAIFVERDGCLCGTYGTDRHGRTTDEHGNRIPLTVVWDGSSWSTWKARLRTHRPQDRRWVRENEDLTEWDGENVITIGTGWVAFTLLQSPDGGLAVMFNDTAITGAPFDETKQEIVSIFCSLLGSITRRRKPRHIYDDIARKLRHDVMNHVYSDKIPGERELARKYAVNFKTINKAVTQLVDEGLLHRLKGRGTFVSHAPAFPIPKANRVGVLIPNLTAPGNARIVESLQQEARGGNIILDIETLPDPAAQLGPLLDSLKDHNVRAVIGWSEVLRDDCCRNALMASGMTAITLGVPFSESDAVIPNESVAARRLTEHLITAFGTPVAFVTDRPLDLPDNPRYAGYVDAHEAQAIPVPSDLVITQGRGFQGGYEAAQALFERAQPQAMLVTDEMMALGAERAAFHAGRPLGLATFMENTDPAAPLPSMVYARFSSRDIAARLLYLVDRRLSFPDKAAKHLSVEPELLHPPEIPFASES